MKKITLFQRAFWILGLTALTVLFMACENELQFQESVNDAGKASVTFNVTDSAARTVLPQVSLNDVAKYTLLGGRNGATETVLVDQFTGTDTSLMLAPGTWNFTLNAYNASNIHILQGKVHGEQINQGNNQVSFSMSGLKSGTGSIQVTFSFPEAAGITQIRTNGDIDSENFTLDSGGNFVYAKTGVNADDYFINFEFYCGNVLHTVISELLLVRNGLTSVKTITLVGENLRPLLTGTVSISGIAEAGQILTANTGLLDGIGTINYQWNRGTTAIPDSVGGIYIVQSADVGSTITVTVTRTGYAGGITSEPTATVVASNSPIITLTANTWENGNIPTSSDVQWFKFTATASTQYIHVSFGTLTSLNVQVYDSSGVAVESESNLSTGSTRYISQTVSSGQEYYIRVRPSISSYSGTYQIGFTTTFYPLGTTALTVNTWADGNLPTSSDVQWFKFTATASTHYIHAGFGTLTSLNVQVYNSSGATVGSETSLSSSGTKYVSRPVTVGQEYYIRVCPSSSSGSGTYQIGFTTTFYPPGTTALTVNTWADGNLPTSSDVQWFKFTATTTGTQYIHVSFGTLTNLYIQVYDSSGATVGSENQPNNSYVSRTVTSGQEYSIRVRPYSSSDRGTYRIGFTISSTAPNIMTLPSAAIQLTENIWADGNFPISSDVQWFKFIATASTQYIHAGFGTLTSLYVQLCDSSGATVGSETNLYSSSTYVSRTVSSGQEYYIRVRPNSSSYSGTYRIGFTTSTTAPNFTLPSAAIQLTENIWADGNLPTSSDVQWFKFTATAGTQYIHAAFGTLTVLYVQLCDSNGATVGSETSLYSSSTYVSRTVTSGQEYYIRVRPNSSSGSGSGTYRIGFTTSSTAPNIMTLPSAAIQLTVNIWADGNLPTSSDVQCFKFTATTTGTQYIHVSFGRLTNLYIQVYDSSGATVGSETNLSIGTYISQSVTSGQEYYIRVRPYSSSYSGTYRIGFTTSTTAPNIMTLPSAAIQLTVNTWADGNLPTSSDVQWFKFTATAGTQYIHAGFGTLNDLYVQVCDSSGATVGNETELYGSTRYVSRSVTVGQEYYIRVRPYGSYNSGTYWIVFATSTTAPNFTLPSAAIQLTENTWADGNLPTSSDVQWFKFTATAGTQYIHAGFGTLTQMYVQMYDSNGATVGSETSLNSGTKYISRTVTSGQEYYIRVRPSGSSYIGTYQIGFTTSTTAPNIMPLPSAVIKLVENTWANGNLPMSSDEQWFKFTVTSNTQRIHVSLGTLTYMYVQFYNSSGGTVGDELELRSSTYISPSLISGQVYYIRVRPYSSSYSGTYRIGFTTSSTAPNIMTLPSIAIQLTVNSWADGNLPTSSDEQWFKFTATESTQYIHAAFSSLNNLYVQVYDSSGATVGNETELYSITRYVSRSVTVGQEYYVKVRPYNSSYSGTYRIGFNTSSTPPN